MPLVRPISRGLWLTRVVLLLTLCWGAPTRAGGEASIEGELNSTAYSSLAAAVEAAASLNSGVVVTKPLGVTSNLNIPARVALRVGPAGRIRVAPGIVLNVNGSFAAGEHQVFEFDGSQRAPAIRLNATGDWRTSWFLGKSGLSLPSDNVKALQLMVDNIQEGTILFDSAYVVDSPVTLRSLVSIRGNGKNGKAGISLAAGSNTSIFQSPADQPLVRVKISDMYFLGNRAGNTNGGRALDFRGYLQNSVVENCWFHQFKDTAIFADAVGSLLLLSVDVHFCDTGIWINGGAGLDMQNCNVENNYVMGTRLENVKGFTLHGCYLESNPGIHTAGSLAHIFLRNCAGGSIAGNYFMNYGPLAVDLRENTRNVTIEDCYFYWAHGTPYRWDGTCSGIVAQNNFNYNAHGRGDQTVAVNGLPSDNPLSVAHSAKDRFQVATRMEGMWNVWSNLFDLRHAPGGWVRKAPTEQPIGSLRVGPATYAVNSLVLTHTNRSHAYASYWEIKPTSFAPNHDVVAFIDAPEPIGDRTRLGWAVNQQWFSRRAYRANESRDAYYANRRGRFIDIQYVPPGITNLTYRLQPTGGWLTLRDEFEAAQSALRNGAMDYGFTNGLAAFWQCSGSPTVSPDCKAYVRTWDDQTNALISQKVSGTTNDMIYQALDQELALASSPFQRVGFSLRVDSGCVGVGRRHESPNTLGRYEAKRSSEQAGTWCHFERVVPSSPHDLQFTCLSSNTLFYLRDVFVVSVSEFIHRDAPYRFQRDVAVDGNLSSGSLTLGGVTQSNWPVTSRLFPQRHAAPSAAEIGGSLTTTNHRIENVNGVLMDYWSNGREVWSRQLSP